MRFQCVKCHNAFATGGAYNAPPFLLPGFRGGKGQRRGKGRIRKGREGREGEGMRGKLRGCTALKFLENTLWQAPGRPYFHTLKCASTTDI